MQTQNSDPRVTPEDLILQMEPDELQELLAEMGFPATAGMVQGIRQLVAELGSLDAAIVTLNDDQVMRRAA